MTVKTGDLRKLGRRIRVLRLEGGLSQEELAGPNYTAAYMSHIEKGNRRPSHEALVHISERLGVTLEQLLSGRDPNDDLRLDIEIQQAIATVHSGNAASALGRLEIARSQAQEVGNERAILRAEEGLGLAFFRLGRIDEAIGAFTRAEEHPLNRSPEERTIAITGRARCLFHTGETREALHALEQHLIALRGSEAPDPTALVATFSALIPLYFETGMVDKAKDIAAEGWKLAPAAGDPEQKACLYLNRAQLLLTQGEPREALTSLALAEDLYRQLGWFNSIVKVTLARALALTEAGKLDEAESLLTEALTSEQGVADRDHSQVLAHLARIERMKGNAAAALAKAREAAKLAKAREPIIEAEAEREAGLSAGLLNDGQLEIRSLRRALILFKRCGHHEEVARTARLLGDALAASGDQEGAARAYRDGLGSVERLH